ncbi:MAG: chemotaxis protein CheB [Moraxella sp.]|nr:chemotaxis protein CheB [Moraxella sp.]
MRPDDHQGIFVMVITDDRNQRFAFDDTLRQFGFTVVGCYGTEQFERVAFAKLDKGLLWLIDTPLEPSLHTKIMACEPKLVLMGFDKAPSLSHLEQYQRWQKVLVRQIRKCCGLPALPKHKWMRHNRRWRYVLLLGASMGGIPALKDFLAHVSADLPLTVVVAYHFDGKMIHMLPKTLTAHNDWDCQVITKNQRLRAGQCLIVPTEHQVVFDSDGRVRLLDTAWQVGYQPNISLILKNMSDVYADEFIGIIFSGMGNDGSHYLSQISQNNSHLWSQSLESSSCTSQPQAMIESGFCQFVGSPLELAYKVNAMVKQ